MRNYLPTFLKLLSGLLFLGGLGLYVFRVPLMDSLLIGQLTQLGVPLNSVTVEEVSLNELELGKLSLGLANELQADRIKATWTLSGLFAGELQALEVSGLQLSLDLTGANPPLGSLQKLIGDAGAGEKGKLPQVSLLDATIELHAASGNYTVSLHGDLKPGPSDTTLIAIHVETTAEPGHVIADLSATLEAGGKLQGVLTVSDASLSLPELTISAIRGKSSFEWNDNQPHAVSAAFDLSHIDLPGCSREDEAFDRGVIALQMNATEARMKGELMAAEDASAVAFTVALNDYRHRPGIAAEVTADVNADSVIWCVPGLAQPDKGSASLTVKADGKMPALLPAGDDWHSWLQNSTLQGEGVLRLDGLDFAHKVADLDGDVGIEAELDDGRGILKFAENSSIEASGLNSDWVAGLGVPSMLLTGLNPDTKLRIKSKGENSASVTIDRNADKTQMDLATDLEFIVDKARADISAKAEVAISQQNQVTAFKLDEANVISSGFRYAGNTIDRLTLRGNLQGSAETWAGELDLVAEVERFQLEQLDARKAKVSLPMRISFKEQGGLLSLRKPGNMTVTELAPFKAFQVQGPVKLHLPRSDIRFARGSGGLSLENQITLQPGNFTLLVNRDGAPGLEMEVRPAQILHRGKMEATDQFSGKGTISLAAITLPQYQIQLEKITTTIHHGEPGKRLLADFSIDRLQHLVPKPYFAPVNLAGKVKLMNEDLFIDALGGIPDKQYLKFVAALGLDTGEGNLKLDVTPLTFSPDALQPAALFPDLVVLKSVSGSASATSHVSWLNQDLKSGAEINLQNLSFTQDGTTISGLSAALQLTDLLSPESPPQQKMTIQRIDPGVPMENVEIIYKIQQADAAQLSLDKVQLSMIGGTLSAGPTVIEPLSSSTAVVVQVTDLDLEKLFKLIDVEGLAGDGRLDGSIPLTLTDDSVSIQDGLLAAKKPGILRLKSEKVSEMLAGSAEEVDLLLQALTEFHYSELIFKLNNSANNDLLTSLSLLGNNPNVLEGRLFRLNISLESNINDFLKALGQAYGVSSKALQRAFRLH